MENLNLPLTIKVFKDGSSKESPFVAYNPELDVSSCGRTEEEAKEMLEEAISLTISGAVEDGTLNQLLAEAGLSPTGKARGFAKTYFSFFNFSLPLQSNRKAVYA